MLELLMANRPTALATLGSQDPMVVFARSVWQASTRLYQEMPRAAIAQQVNILQQ